MKERFSRNRQLVTVLLLWLSTSSFSGFAQEKHFQVWTDFNARFDLKNRFQINIEPGYRTEPRLDLHVAYFRTALRYNQNSIIAVDFGLANFNVWTPGIVSSIEFRTFEYLFINWPSIGEFKFKIRMGIEQRWFNLPQLETTKFLHRARLRLGLRSPYFAFWQGKPKLFLTTNFEMLGNINDGFMNEIVDHSRFMAGLGFLDGKQFRLELHYQLMDLVDIEAFQIERDKNLIRIRGFYYFKTP